MNNEFDPTLVGDAILMAKRLCDQLDFQLVLDGNRAYAKDVQSQFILSAVEETWLDSLLLLIGKLKISVEVLERRERP